MHFHSHRSHTVLKYIGHEQSIVYGSTKGFVSYGGFTHVGFPYARRFPLPHFIRLVSNYHSPLSLPLPSRRSRVPASAVVLTQSSLVTVITLVPGQDIAPRIGDLLLPLQLQVVGSIPA